MHSHPGEILKRGIYFLIPPPILADDHWKTHLSLAVGVHLFAVIMAIIAPFVFQFSPRLPEVYTVDLFSATEISTPPVAQPAKPKIVEPRKAKKKIAVKKETTPPPAVKPAPPKAVSLKPITKTKNDVEKVADLKKRLEAERQAQKVQEAAEKDINNALEQLRQSLLSQSESSEAEAPSDTTPRQSGGSVTLDAVTRQYYSDVNSQLQEHWSLLMREWKGNLEAVAVIKVRRDGVVTKMFFERKSNNMYYNREVENTIQNASPLPPFPAELKKPEIELAIVFRPGDIF